MKYLIYIGLLFCTAAFASPPIATNLTQTIADSETNYGALNFKMVMPGLLYRGGSNGLRLPLSTESLQKLCEDNFTTAVYVYNRQWNDRVSQTVQCKNGNLNYIRRRWDQPKEVYDILKKLHKLIIEGRGAMYIHCWYGMHASGYVATVALMQFCHLSSEQGVAYWNSNVPKKLRYTKVQDMIRRFQPDPTLKLSITQQQQFCPHNLQ